MTPTHFTLYRLLARGTLVTLSVLAAACDRALPTADELDRMTAATVTAAAGKSALIDTSNVIYYVNDVATAKDAANAIVPDSIVSVSVTRSANAAGEIRITTRKPGDSPLGPYARVAEEDAYIALDSGRNIIPIRILAPLHLHAGQKGPEALLALVVVNGVITEPLLAARIAENRIVGFKVIKADVARAKYADPRARNGAIEITTRP